MNKPLPNVELRRVGNGVIVTPPYDISRDRTAAWDETLVFDDLKSLVQHVEAWWKATESK